MLSRILITAKTYPSISKKYDETVCTAGILLDSNNEPVRWIRLYPIPFRYMDIDKQFPKYSIIQANIEKSKEDTRPESYKIDKDTVTILPDSEISKKWDWRKRVILPFLKSSIDEIRQDGESLGIIKPCRISKTYFEPTEREWSEDKQAVLNQKNIFYEKKNLNKVPFTFGYEFYDLYDDNEIFHRMSILDWEISALYWNCFWRAKGSDKDKEQEAIDKVMQKLDGLINKTELHFMVGNQHRYPQTFMLVGLFYPPIVPPVEGRQTSLFDL